MLASRTPHSVAVTEQRYVAPPLLPRAARGPREVAAKIRIARLLLRPDLSARSPAGMSFPFKPGPRTPMPYAPHVRVLSSVVSCLAIAAGVVVFCAGWKGPNEDAVMQASGAVIVAGLALLGSDDRSTDLA